MIHREHEWTIERINSAVWKYRKLLKSSAKETVKDVDSFILSSNLKAIFASKNVLYYYEKENETS